MAFHVFDHEEIRSQTLVVLEMFAHMDHPFPPIRFRIGKIFEDTGTVVAERAYGILRKTSIWEMSKAM
jgi:hypothetical protein